jgi:anti-sigma regulatory factor (Ser/Thr protein kinase)
MLSGDMKMSTQHAQRLLLRNELIELDRLAGWIAGLADRGMSPNMSLAVQICLEEVVANIIMYSASENKRLRITVELERAGETLMARIGDNGREFDPTQAPPPTVAGSLKEAKVGNLGIHLVRNFANGMNYQRHGGRNQLTLRFIEPRAASMQ